MAGTYNAIQILKTVGATFEKQMKSFRRQFYLRFAREESIWVQVIWGLGSVLKKHQVQSQVGTLNEWQSGLHRQLLTLLHSTFLSLHLFPCKIVHAPLSSFSLVPSPLPPFPMVSVCMLVFWDLASWGKSVVGPAKYRCLSLSTMHLKKYVSKRQLIP